MATFGELLVYLQARAGVATKELASAAALSERQIEFLRSGERRPTPASRQAICDALGLSDPDRAALLAAAAAPTSDATSPGGRPAGPAPGATLRMYRLLAGMTLDTLARESGVNRNYLQQIESGERHPGWRALRRFSKALRLTSQDQAALFNAAGGAPPPSIAPGEPAPAIYDPAVPSLIGVARIVGRDETLATLQRLLAGEPDGPRAIALVGIPGSGKTTIATAIAQEPALRDRFQHGVLWGPLGPRPNIASRRAEWARLLGARPEAIQRATTPDDWKRLLRDAIGDRSLLLVLDDAWSFEDAQALCAGGPNCALLVTTRSPGVAYELAGQDVFVIRELGVEESAGLVRSVAPSLRAATGAQALRLERALVDLAGGLPLSLALIGRAIEELSRRPPRTRQATSGGARPADPTAAALWSLTQALGSARRRVQLTKSNPLTGLDISLRAVISTSEERLSPVEREAFRSLGVLPPKPETFSWEAALAVSGATDEVFERLTGSGLVERSGGKEGDARERARYALHQTINDYARAEGALDGAERRLVHYYVEFAERHAIDFDALAVERPNLLDAMTLAARRGQREDLVRLVVACAESFQARGLHDLIEPRLARAEEAARRLGDQGALASILNYRALNADHEGHETEAYHTLLKAITFAYGVGDERKIARFLVTLGMIRSRGGLYQQAMRSLTRATSMAKRLEMRPLQAMALREMSATAFASGDTEAATIYAIEGLVLARALNDPELISGLLSALGNMTSNRGRYHEAASYLLESLGICLEHGYDVRAAFVSTNLATVNINLGEYDRAAHHIGVALRIGEERGHSLRVAYALVIAAQIDCARGDDDTAEARFTRAKDLMGQRERPDRLVDLYTRFAELEIERGELARARVYLRRAQDILKTTHDYPEHRALIALRMGEVTERGAGPSEVAKLDGAASLFEEALVTGRALRHPELVCVANIARGRLYLKQGQLELAEEAFRAALPDDLEHRPLEAEARFGLAQALAARYRATRARALPATAPPNMEEALRAGARSLELFEKMGHRRARAVRAWLARIPSEATPGGAPALPNSPDASSQS